MNENEINNLKLQAELEKLRAENARLKKKSNFTMKVSEKGCVSLYGLGSRFPISLYPGQAETLLSHADEIRAFIEEHKGELKFKE